MVLPQFWGLTVKMPRLLLNQWNVLRYICMVTTAVCAFTEDCLFTEDHQTNHPVCKPSGGVGGGFCGG